MISNASKIICGIALIAVPAIEYGGVYLARGLLMREDPIRDNSARQTLTRAAHAHAGELLLLSLICQILLDSLDLPQALSWFIRIGVLTGTILVPMGFLLSSGAPPTEQPEGAMQLVFSGDFILAIALLTLGSALLFAAM